MTYVEDLRLMPEFGRAILDSRNGKVRDALDAVGLDDVERDLGRQKRREALLARFERQRANAALGLLATAGAGATP